MPDLPNHVLDALGYIIAAFVALVVVLAIWPHEEDEPPCDLHRRFRQPPYQPPGPRRPFDHDRDRWYW